MAQLFLRFDGTHELPLIVETEKGAVIARFLRAGDLSIFVSADRRSLPKAFLLQLNGQ